ncbi:MAG: hypothetical protein GFH27_549283n162 [Chloroflexi bacterium AL-W]|nr:hypothetical protein [Chloroflexi bacterium AL-N1]NOK64717.1 hypothetical protein [Chloroflexi bacterium AL-N10]NOK75958.1 hypothetical protein [Chloroflexi bacterium AL-N5]NOK80283.1 hypothetical protein [Chloroflexi bacterium AL-W]NOK86796.1 hypothetical protein [Chloroflexi bacterium AL-N15]
MNQGRTRISRTRWWQSLRQLCTDQQSFRMLLIVFFSMTVIQPLTAAVLLPISDEILVNETAAGYQGTPSVATDAEGNFVVAWISFNQDGDSFGIYARRFTSDGLPASGEFQVNTTTVERQVLPTVSMNAEGSFVITWQSRGQDGDGEAVYVRAYADDGLAVTGEVAVNTTTMGDQSRPTAGIDGTGNFVVAWQSDGQDGDGFGIYARRFLATGAPVDGEFPVSITTTGDQEFPELGMAPDGRFVVAWQSDGQDGSSDGIYMRRFTADGMANGGEVAVNTFTNNRQFNPAISVNVNGDFAMTWESAGQDGDDTGIYARRFTADGMPATEEVAVNTTTVDSQRAPGIVLNGDGSFVVAWTSVGQDGDGSGVYMRRFAADGTPTTDELQINITTVDFQELPELITDTDSNPIVVWQSRTQGSIAQEVYFRRYEQDDPPTISSVSDVSVEVGTTPVLVDFTVNDAETALTDLTLTATSSNQTLVPNVDLLLSGTDTDRTLAISPVPGETGVTTITLGVDDGFNDVVTTTFTLTVLEDYSVYLPLIQR